MCQIVETIYNSYTEYIVVESIVYISLQT